MRRTEHPQIELQIAPMIDVCFLLLFFYILTSKPIKPEADMSLSLPGTVSQEESVDIPDETRIVIQADGQVIVNELPVDSAQSTELPGLFTILKRFKEAAVANKSEPMVTVDAEDGCRHQRIVDVLNVCAKVEIGGVTFADDAEEEQ